MDEQFKGLHDLKNFLEEKNNEKDILDIKNLKCKKITYYTLNSPLSIKLIDKNNNQILNNKKWVHQNINLNKRENNLKRWMPNEYVNMKSELSKFDKKFEIEEYDDEFYDLHLKNLDKNWNKEETDYLWNLLKNYEMRFIIIHDRYDKKYNRTLNEIKVRSYSILKKIKEIKKIEKIEYLDENFDELYEVHRKLQLEKYLSRSKLANIDEEKIIEEIKKIDSLIRKKEKEQINLKKLLDISKKEQDILNFEKNNIDSNLNELCLKDKTAFFRSSIIYGSIPNISSNLNKKLEQSLQQLIPERLYATQDIQNLYDKLRSKLLKLLTFKITHSQNESKIKMLQEKINLKTN